jgi:hypothetical protein
MHEASAARFRLRRERWKNAKLKEELGGCYSWMLLLELLREAG